MCDGLVVNVEIKCLPWEPDADPEHARRPGARSTSCASATSTVVVSSFDLGDRSTRCARYAPELATGFLVHRLRPRRCAAQLARDHGHAWLHPDRRVDARPRPSRRRARCTSRGLRVERVDRRRSRRDAALAAAGVDAIITNVPDVALAVARLTGGLRERRSSARRARRRCRGSRRRRGRRRRPGTGTVRGPRSVARARSWRCTMPRRLAEELRRSASPRRRRRAASTRSRRPEGRQRERVSQPGFGGDDERPRPEVGVRRRLRDDREVARLRSRSPVSSVDVEARACCGRSGGTRSRTRRRRAADATRSASARRTARPGGSRPRRSRARCGTGTGGRSTRPRPIRVERAPFERRRAACSVASTGSSGTPSVRGVHVGRAAGERRERGARCRPGRRPPRSACRRRRARRRRRSRRSRPRCASRVAWPRRDVSATSTSWCAASILRISTRLRAVTDDAVAFTSRRTRIGRRRVPVRILVCRVSRAPPRSRRARGRDRRVSRVSAPRRLARAGRAEKRASFRDEEYWGRPVPGFGDPRARVARRRARARGARRQPHRSGLHRRPVGRLPLRVAAPDRVREPADVGHASTTACVLHDAYIAAAVRCAPPANKPTPAERDECRPVPRPRARAPAPAARRRRARCVRLRGGVGGLAARGPPSDPGRRPAFAHGLEVPLRRASRSSGSFHPSQQNTFTGKLTPPMLDAVFTRAKELASCAQSNSATTSPIA